MTQIVKHSSRIITYESTFQINAPDTASFLSVSDNEIFDIELENIASYTINGNTITLPFTLSRDLVYSISIARTNPAQESSIKIKSRLEDDTTNLFNSIDVTIFNGRFIYMLDSVNNQLYKLDSTLLESANYLGGGSFTVSPLLSTIALPTPTDGAGWRRMVSFVRGGNVKILIINDNSVVAENFYNAIVLDENDNVYNLDETVLNTATQLAAQSTSLTTVHNVLVYDYINNNALHSGRGLAVIDLTTSTKSKIAQDKDPSATYYDETVHRMSFQPQYGEFLKWPGHRYSELFFYGYRNVFQSINRCEFSPTLQRYYYSGNNNPFLIEAVDRQGNGIFTNERAVRPSTSTYLAGPTSNVLGQGARFVYHLTPGLIAVVYNHSDGSGSGGITMTNNGATGYYGAIPCDNSSLFLALDNTGNRLHFIDITGYVGYYDLPSTCIDLMNNQIMR